MAKFKYHTPALLPCVPIYIPTQASAAPAVLCQNPLRHKKPAVSLPREFEEFVHVIPLPVEFAIKHAAMV